MLRHDRCQGLLTPRDVAEILGVRIETVWRYLRTGALRGRKIGKTRYWRISPDDLSGFLLEPEP